MYKFKFADIGEGLHEGTVAEIYVKEGQQVEEGDSLFSVETDKVTSDIPSPVTGKVAKINIETGQLIHVGEEVFQIDDGSTDSAPAPAKKEEAKPAAKAEEAASVVGSIEVSDKQLDLSSLKSQKVVSSKIKHQDNVRTTPLARAMAAERGIDITQIRGTGANGKVLVRDLDSAPVASANNVSRKVVSNRQDETKKVTPLRKAIARAMENSWNNVAYTNLVTEVNMTRLFNDRKPFVKEILETTGVKVTFTALVAKATIVALQEFPMMNAKFNKETEEITTFGNVNLGIAVDTPKGLVVPVIKNAEQKSLVEISQEISELAGKARNGKLTSADMTGGTFTLTNYGTSGALYGVPVINYPELAILGMGAMIDRVMADDKGNFYNGKIMYLTGAADHKWIDGADVGRFTARIKQLLENPLMLGAM